MIVENGFEDIVRVLSKVTEVRMRGGKVRGGTVFILCLGHSILL